MNHKRILILNLPFSTPVIRRYSCSYYAVGFLYPPQELLRVATLVKTLSKKFKDVEGYFIDAIGENKTLKEVIDFINTHNITHIITLLGIDFLEDDLQILKKIKNKTNAKIIGINFLLSWINKLLFENLKLKFSQKKFLNIEKKFSHFLNYLKEGSNEPKETINFNNNLINLFLKNLLKYDFPDYILDNRFEVAIKKWLEDDEKFLRYSYYNKLTFDPNIIPYVDHSILNNVNKYHELFVNGKTSFLYFGFGCPFNCIYCIRSYDLKGYVKRDVNNIMQELIVLNAQGYKNIRILDDNVTIDVSFLQKINEFLKSHNLKFNFYGLSRIDLIDEQRVKVLKDMNFKRLYLGLETFNPSLQKYYEKNIDVSIKNLKEKFYLLKKSKIETGLWLLYHPEIDNINTIKTTIFLLKKLKPDFVNMSILTPYPNTKLFDLENSKITLNNLKFEFVSRNVELEYLFFKSYLLSPENILKSLKYFLIYPRDSLNVSKNILFPYFFRKKSSRKDVV